MYSQWSKSIPWKIIDNVPIFVHQIIKYIELHVQNYPGISKSLQIIANHQWFVPRFIEKSI